MTNFLIFFLGFIIGGFSFLTIIICLQINKIDEITKYYLNKK